MKPSLSWAAWQVSTSGLPAHAGLLSWPRGAYALNPLYIRSTCGAHALLWLQRDRRTKLWSLLILPCPPILPRYVPIAHGERHHITVSWIFWVRHVRRNERTQGSSTLGCVRAAQSQPSHRFEAGGLRPSIFWRSISKTQWDLTGNATELAPSLAPFGIWVNSTDARWTCATPTVSVGTRHTHDALAAKSVSPTQLA